MTAGTKTTPKQMDFSALDVGNANDSHNETSRSANGRHSFQGRRWRSNRRRRRRGRRTRRRGGFRRGYRNDWPRFSSNRNRFRSRIQSSRGNGYSSWMNPRRNRMRRRGWGGRRRGNSRRQSRSYRPSYRGGRFQSRRQARNGGRHRGRGQGRGQVNNWSHQPISATSSIGIGTIPTSNNPQ
ncbi:hypothetical protein RDWZM_001960 [Blomia tropicalis]|uniref:Uncharacterized protein n=1 Tax=Blomia tropicalis TaxID=40697 RepID=A0A9Q0MH18_BLOTA|nr:hypothetical protein RDWZM_001960 [Blomia tropicalis]